MAEALGFGSHRSNYMQTVIETIEFFKLGDEEWYAFDKIILFCLLYFDERKEIRASCLFYLMCDENDKITSRNGQVKTIIAMLTLISTMIPAEIIKSVSTPIAAAALI